VSPYITGYYYNDYSTQAYSEQIQPQFQASQPYQASQYNYQQIPIQPISLETPSEGWPVMSPSIKNDANQSNTTCNNSSLSLLETTKTPFNTKSNENILPDILSTMSISSKPELNHLLEQFDPLCTLNNGQLNK
jgi:hypothetical protein